MPDKKFIQNFIHSFKLFAKLGTVITVEWLLKYLLLSDKSSSILATLFTLSCFSGAAFYYILVTYKESPSSSSSVSYSSSGITLDTLDTIINKC
jgi:hypothetical protein